MNVIGWLNIAGDLLHTRLCNTICCFYFQWKLNKLLDMKFPRNVCNWCLCLLCSLWNVRTMYSFMIVVFWFIIFHRSAKYKNKTKTKKPTKRKMFVLIHLILLTYSVYVSSYKGPMRYIPPVRWDPENPL